MMKKRHKLRLRKQVIICIPVAISIMILTIGLLINKNNTFSEIKQNNNLTSQNKINDGLKISDLSFIKDFNKMVEQRKKDNTIIYYAQLFKLDIDKTLELAHNYTNNFENSEYQTHNVIGPDKVKQKVGSFSSFEAGVAYFARDLYRYPEKYGLTISDIRLDETPTLKEVSTDGNIYMNNGLTFEQYLGKICDLFNMDKELVLAISYHEAGIKTSNLFKNSNNIGGHRGYAGWMKFTTLEAGIIAHVLAVKAIVDNYNIDVTSENGIAELSSVYVNGHAGNPSYFWAEKITYYMEAIEEKDLFTLEK